MPIPLFLLLLLIFSGCQREPELYRLIDRTTATNIVSSPLTTLARPYEIKEQNLRAEDAFLYELENLKYWAIPTEFPLIADNESERPEGMVVLRNGQDMPFVGNIFQSQYGWMWTRFRKHIEPERSRAYKKFKQKNALVLSRNTYFLSDDFYIPKDRIEILIHAGSQNPNGYGINLKIFLDERLKKTLLVRDRKPYRVHLDTDAGKSRLKVGFSTVEKSSLSPQREQLILGAIHLKSTHDFVLCASTAPKPNALANDDMKAIYHTYVGDKKLFPIYLIQNKHKLRDSGIGENPLEMKKKLMIGNQSVNALFAPPKTVLRYEVNIPKSGVLDFGYGLMREAWTKRGDGTQFSIIVKTGDTEASIFSANINPFRHVEHRNVFRRQLDLSDYGGQKAELAFITEKNNSIHNDLSFWCNPYIYQPQDPLHPKKKKPINVILISLDTLRADHLGCYGYSRNTSPNIDILSRDGVLFKYCYSTAPSTLIAHMSLMTSLNPKSHRVYNDKIGDKLSPEFLTFADVLRSRGYYCGAMTGSGLVSAIFGFSKGFDEYHEDRYSIFKGNSAENLFSDVSEWLNHNRDKKFFLFLHTYQPHNPYKNNSSVGKTFLREDAEWQHIDITKYLRELKSEIPVDRLAELEDWEKRVFENSLFKFRDIPDSKRQNVVDLYDGDIRHTDEYLIKPLLSELKRLNIYENTMIVLLSDHGESFFDHQMWEHGIQLYNELIRVPLIIKYPYSRKRGHIVDKSVGIIDVLPTVLEELGITPHSQCEGEQVNDMVDGKKVLDRIYFAEARAQGIKIAAVRGNDKLIYNGAPKSVYSLVGIPGRMECYNLHRDPAEKNTDRIQNTEELTVLLKHLLQYLNEVMQAEKKSQQSIKLPTDLEEQFKALGYIE